MMFRLCALMAAVLLAGVTSGCGRKDAASKPAAPAAAGAVAMQLDPKGEVRLARAYREIRCALVGGPPAGAGIYRDQGFADAAAFLDAFAAQAAAHPDWARATLTAAQADPCGGSASPIAKPAAPTPTDEASP